MEDEDGFTNEDFFLSKRQSDGYWSSAVRLEKPINTHDNEGAMTLSATEDLLVFTACERSNGYGDCDLYFSYKLKDWSNPLNLGKHINSIKSDVFLAISD